MSIINIFIDTVKYDALITVFVKEVQELKQENNMLKQELCEVNPNYSWCET